MWTRRLVTVAVALVLTWTAPLMSTDARAAPGPGSGRGGRDPSAGAIERDHGRRGREVGQVTVVEGDGVRTGVTAILPHGGNVFRERVPAAVHVGNGFGKLLGVTQLRELGELETPILLDMHVVRLEGRRCDGGLAPPAARDGGCPLDQPGRR